MSTLKMSETSKNRYTLLLILSFTMVVNFSCVTEEDGFYEKKFLEGTNVIEGPPVGPDEDAQLVIEDAYIEFGKVPMFYPARRIVEIKNTGGYPATILSKFPTFNFSFFGGKYPGKGGTCGAVVSTSETCKLVFGFTPTEEREYTETLVFEYNTGYTTQAVVVDMIGSGIDIPFVYFDEYDDYDFGQAHVATNGSSDTLIFREVTLKYAGGKDKVASNIFINKILAPFEEVAGGSCLPGQSLTHGESCTFKIRFNPYKKFSDEQYGEVVSFNEQLVISYYNGASKNYSKVNLNGSVTSQKIGAVLSIVGEKNFTSEHKVYPNTKIEKEFIIKKVSGNQAAINLSFTIKDNKLFKIVANSCSKELEFGSCVIKVEFTAGNTILLEDGKVEKAATFRDSIILSYNDGLDPKNQETLFDIEGTSGAKPIIGITYASKCKDEACNEFDYNYSFGDVSTRYTRSKTFLVSVLNKVESVPVVSLTFDTDSKIVAPFSLRYNGGSRMCSKFKESKLFDYCYFYVSYKKDTLNEIATSFNEVNFKIEQTINRPENVTKEDISLKIAARPSPKALLVVSGSMNFGWVVFNNKSVVRKMTLYHYGEEPATNIKLFRPLTLPKPFFFESEAMGTCGDTLIKGERCTIGAYFAPTLDTIGYNTTAPHDTNGKVENRYTLTYSNGYSVDNFVENELYNFEDFVNRDEVKTNVVEFRGYAKGPGFVTYKSYLPTIDKPKDWDTGNHFVTLYNTTSEHINTGYYNLPVTIKSVKFSEHSDMFSASGCNVINARKSCNLKVSFVPKDLVDYKTQMTIEYDNGNGEIKTAGPIEIVAKGYANIELHKIFPTALADVLINEEVNVKNSSSITLTFKNMGNVKAVDTVISEEGLGDKFSISNNACAGSLNVGATCSVTLTFTPDAIPGKDSVSIKISAINAELKASNFVANSIVEKIIVAGEGFNCVRNKLAEVYCWGENRRGQLGRDSFISSHTPNLVDLGLESREFVKDITAGGGNHTCILTNHSRVKCWGANDNGQLGVGDTIDRGGSATQFTMKKLGFIAEFGVDRIVRKIKAGVYHTCAILQDNDQLYCFGLNSFGQLGNKSTENSSVPVKVFELDKVKDVALGGGHTCALNFDGEVFCFGSHEKAQIGGLGDNVNYISSPFGPIDLGLGLKASSISAQGGHTCAIIEGTKELKCFGENRYGEINDTELVGVLGSCFARSVSTNEIVKCWEKGADVTPMYGYGFSATEMGDNLPIVNLDSVNTLKSTDKFSVEKVIASNLSTCVLGFPSEEPEVSQLKCFGDNSSGQILQGEVVNVGGLEGDMDNLKILYSGAKDDIVKIVSGPQHMCAMFKDGKIKCWGGNNSYQLGSSNLALIHGDEEIEKISNAINITIP